MSANELEQLIADVKAFSGEVGPGPGPYFKARGLDYEAVKEALMTEALAMAELTATAIDADDGSLDRRHFAASMCAAMAFGLAYGMELQRRRQVTCA